MTGTVEEQLAKRQQARDMYAKGFTRAEIARTMGVTQPAVGYWLRQPKDALRLKLAKQAKNNKKIVAAYQQGRTMAEIGKSLKISGERVRQILKEHQIVGAPRTSKQAEKQTATQLRKEARAAKLWGLDWNTYQQLRGQYGTSSVSTSPFQRYIEQRRNARVRRIGWRITFADWWSIWQQSGKWNLRGRGKGYCMARLGDVGPYALGNVEIIPIKENSRQARLKTLSKSFSC